MQVYLQSLTTPSGRKRHSDAKPILMKLSEIDNGESFPDVLDKTGLTIEEARKVYYTPTEAKMESVLKYLGGYGKIDMTVTAHDGQKYRLVV